MIVTTKELLNMVKERAINIDTRKIIVEASLILQFGLKATHFIYYDNNVYYDEGIDGYECKYTYEQFILNYGKSNWKIDEGE